MERFKQFGLGMVVLAVILCGGYALLVGAFVGLRYLWHVFLSLPKEVAVAVVAASATVFASALAVTVGQYLQRQASIRQEIRKANAPAYEQWVELWFRIMFSEKMGMAPLTEQETVQQLNQFSQQLMLWGSDRAVKEWVLLRLSLADAADIDTDANPEVTMANMGKLAQFIRTIRRDMGHRNRGLDNKTILGIWINDAAEYFD